MGLSGKESTCKQKTWVQFLGWDDLLEEEMANHSSILALEIPWREKPGGLQSIGSQELVMTKETWHTRMQNKNKPHNAWSMSN